MGVTKALLLAPVYVDDTITALKQAAPLTEQQTVDALHTAVWYADNLYHQEAALIFELVLAYTALPASRLSPTLQYCLVAAANTSNGPRHIKAYLRACFSTPVSLPLAHPALAPFIRGEATGPVTESTYCLPTAPTISVITESLLSQTDIESFQMLIDCYARVAHCVPVTDLFEAKYAMMRVLQSQGMHTHLKNSIQLLIDRIVISGLDPDAQKKLEAESVVKRAAAARLSKRAAMTLLQEGSNARF
jgi:hypothetical protein